MNSDQCLLKHALLFILAPCISSSQLAAENEGQWKQQADQLETKIFPKLLKATKVTVYSLAPYDPNDNRMFREVAFDKQENEALNTHQKNLIEKAKMADKYHGHPVLGSAILTDPSRCKALAEELVAASRTFDTPTGDIAESSECHYPRHGLSIQSGQLEMEFTICFECGNAYGYDLSDKADKKAIRLIDHFDSSFAGYLNAILDASGQIRLRDPYNLRYLLPEKRDKYTVAGDKTEHAESNR